MNKKKIRKILVYCLLAFVLFLYIFTIFVFLFGEKEAALAVFAYSSFFTVVVYFLAIYQKRLSEYDQLEDDNVGNNVDDKEDDNVEENAEDSKND